MIGLLIMLLGIANGNFIIAGVGLALTIVLWGKA